VYAPGVGGLCWPPSSRQGSEVRYGGRRGAGVTDASVSVPGKGNGNVGAVATASAHSWFSRRGGVRGEAVGALSPGGLTHGELVSTRCSVGTRRSSPTRATPAGSLLSRIPYRNYGVNRS